MNGALNSKAQEYEQEKPERLSGPLAKHMSGPWQGNISKSPGKVCSIANCQKAPRHETACIVKKLPECTLGENPCAQEMNIPAPEHVPEVSEPGIILYHDMYT